MAGSNDFPTHAYIPGKTERHAEGCFDSVRKSARIGMTPQELSASDAFQTGLTYLDAGYYWEAHELLEPVWMALPQGGNERQLVQALIQLANAQLKLKMHRPKAARRLCGIVRGLLSDAAAGDIMGLDLTDVTRKVDSLEEMLNCEL